MAKIPGLRRAKARQYFYVVRPGCPEHRVVLTSRGRYVFLDHAPYEVQNAIAAKALGAQYACGCPEFLETTRATRRKIRPVAERNFVLGSRLDRRVRRNGAKFPDVLTPLHIDQALWESRVYVHVPAKLDEYLARVLLEHLNAYPHFSWARITMEAVLQEYQGKGYAKACCLDSSWPVQRYHGHTVQSRRYQTAWLHLRPVLSLDRIVRSVADTVRALIWASWAQQRANAIAMKNRQADAVSLNVASKGALAPGAQVNFGSFANQLSVRYYDYPRGILERSSVVPAPNFDLALTFSGLSRCQALAIRQLILRHRDTLTKIVNFRSKLNP